MSYSYERVERRRTTRAGGGGSYGYSGGRSLFGYWVPLALTVTAATIGVVAWVWSERKDDEEESSADEHYPGGIPPPSYAQMSGGLPPGPGPGGFQGPAGPGLDGMGAPPMQGGFQGGPPPPGPVPMGGPAPPASGGFRGTQEDYATSTSVETKQQTEYSWVNRMTNAVGLGDNQSVNWAGQQVAAGMAVAGALVGGAVSSITGGGGEVREDREEMTQEADTRATEEDVKMGIRRRGTADEFFSGQVQLPKRISLPGQKRKTVAIVVSAVELHGDGDEDVGHHASVLSHLPDHIDPYSTRIFVLIYAPDLKAHPLSAVATRRTSQSMASSFSNISQADVHTPAQTPGEYPGSGSGDQGILTQVDPNPIDESSSLYKTLHNQAQAIVEKDTMILPFTSRNGHKHILRSLGPEIVYIQESLCGPDGALVNELGGWVRQVVVIIGDEGGHGGLVDTEDEGEGTKEARWWQREERTGVGRGVSVVESVKIGEDWMRRVGEAD